MLALWFHNQSPSIYQLLECETLGFELKETVILRELSRSPITSLKEAEEKVNNIGLECQFHNAFAVFGQFSVPILHILTQSAEAAITRGDWPSSSISFFASWELKGKHKSFQYIGSLIPEKILDSNLRPRQDTLIDPYKEEFKKYDKFFRTIRNFLNSHK